MKTTVSEKGQITIPKRLRDRLGLRPGTVLDFEEAGGRLVGRKLVPADHLDELLGILDLPGDTDAFVRETRGPGPGEAGPEARGSGPNDPRSDDPRPDDPRPDDPRSNDPGPNDRGR